MPPGGGYFFLIYKKDHLFFTFFLKGHSFFYPHFCFCEDFKVILLKLQTSFMNKDYLNPLRWKKSFLISALAGFVVIWFLFIDNYSLYTRYQLEQQKEELIRKTGELQNETVKLEQKIEELEDNPDLLEKIAREEYGMRKPDETVYKIKSTE